MTLLFSELSRLHATLLRESVTLSEAKEKKKVRSGQKQNKTKLKTIQKRLKSRENKCGTEVPG